MNEEAFDYVDLEEELEDEVSLDPDAPLFDNGEGQPTERGPRAKRE